MDKEILRQKLADEGFAHIYEWRDSSGAEYSAHSHKGKVAMYILDGDLTLWLGSEKVILNKGDRFDVPVGQEHSAKIGPNGCVFLVGEMIKGDS